MFIIEWPFLIRVESLLIFPQTVGRCASDGTACQGRRNASDTDCPAWVWRAAFKIAGGELARRDPIGSSEDEPGVVDPDELVDVIKALYEPTP